MIQTCGKVRTNSKVIYSYRPLHVNEQRQDDQLEPTHSSSLPILDIALKTCWKHWAIENGGEKGSETSMLAARHDYIYTNIVFTLKLRVYVI